MQEKPLGSFNTWNGFYNAVDDVTPKWFGKWHWEENTENPFEIMRFAIVLLLGLVSISIAADYAEWKKRVIYQVGVLIDVH